jgi:hypothetical protein
VEYKKLFPTVDAPVSSAEVQKDQKTSAPAVSASRYSGMFPASSNNQWTPPASKEFDPLMDAFTNPALLTTSGVLGAGTVGAQHMTLPYEVRKEAHNLRRQAAEYVKSGKVPPSGLTSMQTYAGTQQNAIAPQNVDPIKSATPSLVQKNVVQPLTTGTQKMLTVAPGAQPVPGSETGLVHTGAPSTVKELATSNPLTKAATINAPAVTEGTNSAERLLELSQNLSPNQKKMLGSLLQKGYSFPDVLGFFGNVIKKTAVPLAVASIPEQLHMANEYRKVGDYPHMISSGMGALGGAALGAGTGLAAIAAAPEIAAGLGVAGTVAGLAPLAHSAYDWYKERQ